MMKSTTSSLARFGPLTCAFFLLVGCGNSQKTYVLTGRVISKQPATRQLIKVYEATGTGAIAVEEVPRDKTHLYGIFAGEPAPQPPFGERLLRIRDLVEKPKDESLLQDQRVIRVIHGYGTGQLKRALTGFLQQHPLVARFGAAPPAQGGGGVTVVELKE